MHGSRYLSSWLTSAWLSDDALAERIRQDKIDILVDLAGHTANNHLRVFARKPAPVQATWLGYPNTTGLTSVDYRLVDAVTDPLGNADCVATETLVRLEGGFLCYGALAGAPEPKDPPCLTAGAVTFGSFNNPAKLSAATYDAWAALLARLPRSRMLLKGASFADPSPAGFFLARFARPGAGCGSSAANASAGRCGDAPLCLPSGGYCARSISLQRRYYHLRGAVDG